MMRKAKIWGLAVVLTAAHGLPVWSCALLSEEQGKVHVVDESAVIVWNSKTQEEHFIRQANFDSKARDIGFIVPSPSVPKMAAANTDVLQDFEKIMSPEVQYVDNYRQNDWAFTSFLVSRVQKDSNSAKNMISDDGNVQVLNVQSVAGYDATTLRAGDTATLKRWLSKNGYTATPAFVDWLQPYIAKKWVITAFKFRSQKKNDGRITSSLVRMSFKTPRPFYPYSEPQNAKSQDSNQSRSLRVFFVSDAQYKATRQKFGKHNGWPGEVAWSGSLGEKIKNDWSGQIGDVAKKLVLPASAISKKQWLTVFEDDSSPRPGTHDVYFERGSNETRHLETIARMRKKPLPIYIEPLVLVFGLLALGGNQWLKKRKSQETKLPIAPN